MLEKLISLFYLISLLHLAQGQSFQLSGAIQDIDSYPVEFASVLNLNSQDFTYSNSHGQFELSSNEGDTIEIRHVSYLDKRIIVDDASINIVLDQKLEILDEIVVTYKPKQEVVLKKNIKRKAQFGLAMNSDYLIEIENPSEGKLKINRIVIPVNYRKEFSNEGSLLVAIYDSKEGAINPTSLHNITIVDFTNQKELSINLDSSDLYIDQNENLFLFLKRVITDQSFNNKSKNLSVNPFINISENPDNTSTSSSVRILGDDRWTNISAWFGYTPTFDIRIHAQLME